MSQLSSILVIGPAGVIGSTLLHSLIAHKASFARIAAFNNADRPSSASRTQSLAELAEQGIEIVSGTYTTSSAFQGFDIVIMALGNHGLHLQPTIIDTAISAGVRHFYPSEFGADLTVGDNWTQRYYKYKAATREHLALRAKDTPDLGWTLIQIGRLTEYSVIKHFGVDNVKKEANVFGTPEGRQSLLSLKDTITYTIATLLSPPTPRQRSYRFHGASPTWSDLLHILEHITGHTYAVTYHPISEAKEKQSRALALDDVDLELEASHQLVQGSGGTLLPEPWDNDTFPEVRPVGVQEALEAAFADQKVARMLGLVR